MKDYFFLCPANDVAVATESCWQRGTAKRAETKQRFAQYAFRPIVVLGLILVSALTAMAQNAEVPAQGGDQFEEIEKAIRETRDSDAPTTVEEVEVTGRFLPARGKEIEAGLGGLLAHRTGGGLATSIRIAADGSFRKKLRVPATVYVSPRLEGVARRSYGPFKVTADATDLGELRLEPGYSSRILVQDAAGRPIVGARVETATHWCRFDSSKSGQSLSHLVGIESGEDGLLVFQHLTDQPIEISLVKAGFEYDRREMVLPRGETFDWRLRPAAPAGGRFLDEAGRPVAGVELHLAYRGGPSPRSNDPRESFLRHLRGEKRHLQPEAISDSEGGFELPSLRRDTKYQYMALHRDHRPTLLPSVSSGTRLRPVVLQPPLIIQGRVVGPRDHLQERSGKQIFFYRNLLRLDGSNYDTGFHCPLDEEGKFTITQLVAGEVKLSFGEQQVTLDLQESIEDLVINAKSPRGPAELRGRPLQLKLIPLAGQPVRGTVQLYWRLPEAPEMGRQTERKRFAADQPIRWHAPPGATIWFDGSKLEGSHAANRTLGTVMPGTGEVNYAVEVEPAGLVAGDVQDAEGMPVKEFRVDVDRIESARYRFQIHAHRVEHPEGRYALGPLPLGASRQYRMCIQIPNSWQFAVAEPFHVTEESPVVRQSIVMPRRLWLSGSVRDADGRPLAGAKLSMSWRHESTSRSIGTSKQTDHDGNFRLPISAGPLPGELRFSIHPEGFSAGQSFEFAAGQFDADHDLGIIRLQPGATVRGIVVNREGVPQSGARLTLLPDDRDVARFLEGSNGITDDEGAFEIVGVERVPQRFYLFGRKVVDATFPLEIATDDLGNERWRLEPRESEVDVTIVVE